MAVDERMRHRLFRRFEEVLGPEAAAAVTEYLPPVGRSDVATSHDLDAHAFASQRDFTLLRAEIAGLEDRLSLRLEALEHPMTARCERAHRQVLTTVAGLIAGFGATVATVIAR